MRACAASAAVQLAHRSATFCALCATATSEPKRARNDLHHLIGQRDLRHQHQRLASRGQRARRELQINLGLAAGGHAP